MYSFGVIMVYLGDVSVTPGVGDRGASEVS